jgi:tetratricopeptide (TPR) repeat protein
MAMFDEALTDCALAEETASRLGDTESVVEAITSAGLCYFYLRDTRSMATQGNRALEVASAGRSAFGRASAHVVLSLDCLSRGDLESMRDYLDEAIPVVRDSGPPIVSQAATSFRGFLHSLQSEYAAAEPFFGPSLEKAYQAGIQSEVARILWQRGITLANLGRFSESLVTLREGMRVAGNNQTIHWSARFPNTLGWIFAEVGDWEQSHHLNEEGIAISKHAGIPEPEANARINLAAVLCERGELAAAAEQLEESENLLNQRDEKVWMRWRFNIRLRAAQASYWHLRGDLARGQKAASRSLELASAALARKHAAIARRILGDISMSSGNREKALEEYLAGLTLTERHPCPLVEWRLLAGAVASSPENAAAESWRARALRILLDLSRHIEAPTAARRFLESGRAKLGG